MCNTRLKGRMIYFIKYRFENQTIKGSRWLPFFNCICNFFQVCIDLFFGCLRNK